MIGAIVLFSGGMDSTYCLAQAKTQFRRVQALAIDYGQRHAEAELFAARRIAAKLEVPLSLYTLRADWSATLCALSRPLRAGLDEDGISHAFVPGRNLHFVAMAAAHARKHQASTIILGCTADDANLFPDCSSAFVESASVVLRHALAMPSLVVEAPLVETYKRDMVRGATPQLRELLLETWSCYTPTPQGQQCGTCDACRVRLHALSEAA